MVQLGEQTPAQILLGMVDDIAALILETQHDTEIYPDNTDRKVKLEAGNPANTWSDWVELVDDTPATPVTFSSKCATKVTHISGLLIEDLSKKDKRYLMEIAYGDSKTRVLTHRFLFGDLVKKLPAIQFVKIRADHIPAGEKVYYRMKSEEAAATCEISLRYHHHP